MATSSFVQTNFLGGEISQAAQGRLDLPAYKISMNVCLNSFPIETGAWMRRPGTRHVAATRGGAQGRGIPFAFTQRSPYLMQFTDGYLRFTSGPSLVMTNDAQAVVAISTANPAVVLTSTAHGWSTGNSVMFNTLGVNDPLLQNRQCVITVIDGRNFSIADAITGAAIDGSTLGTFVSGNVTRILEIATNYTTGSWSSIRSVQAEARTVLLNGTKPQVLQVATQPTLTQSATFTYGPADFIDGPYLDPIAGSYVSSSALNGLVTLTFSFAAYDATVAYNLGDYVTSAGVGYQSLQTLNQNHTPASSPTYWTPVNAGAPVNSGRGFVTSDIGRLLRLLSEPALWSAGTTYGQGNVVSYSDGNGGSSYWIATGSIPIGIPPGASTLWAISAAGATWTWAQITSVSGSGLIAPVSAFGTLTGGGGLSAAFDGNTSKAFAAGANFTASVVAYPVWAIGPWSTGSACQYFGVGYQALTDIVSSSSLPVFSSATLYSPGNRVQYGSGIYQCTQSVTGRPPPLVAPYWTQIGAISVDSPPNAQPGLWTSVGAMSQPTESVFIGQHYSVATQIQSATIYSNSDLGFVNNPNAGLTITINLRAKTTAPSTASDGVLLGSALVAPTFGSISITSSDQATAYNYVWFEIVSTFLQPLQGNASSIFTVEIGASQAQFFSPNVNNGSVVTAQIRGPALLYAQTIRTWRLGVYSDTTGWPTCGTYHEGRIWFGGVVSNRFDACVSNGLSGVQINMAPTGPSGVVSANNAISYVCNGESVNQILWMKPDQQGVLFGTQAGEWLISAPSAGAMAPTNIKAVRVTKIGCANAEPHRAEHTLLFIQRFGRKIMEYFADVYSGKFSAPNLSERAKHLTVNGLQEIAYQQELVPTVWGRRADGTLVGAIYKRDTLTTSQGPNIVGWHKHQLGSGRTVESICVGPSIGGNLDTLSMITNDLATGVRHIEVLTDLLDEGFALTDCWFLDNGIVPTSTVIQPSTGGPDGSLLVNGLWNHNGKTVTAFIAGLDCGDYTVSNGSITVPFGDGVSGGAGSGLFTAALVRSFATLPAVVGFTYNSDAQLVRPVTQADTGAQSGPGFAKIGRQHRVAAQMYGMVNGSIVFGTDFAKMDAAKLRYPNDTPYTVQQQWSGIWRDNVPSVLDYDGMICWRISRPLPGFVIAAGGFDSKADA